MRISVAHVRSELRAEERKPADVLLEVYEHIHEVTTGTSVGPGDQCSPRAVVHPPACIDGDLNGRRRRRGTERDIEIPAVATPVVLIVEGQDVVGRSRRGEECDAIGPTGNSLEVALVAHTDDDA